MDPNLEDETQGGITGDEELSGLSAFPLQARKHPAALPDADSVIRRFNRNTMYVATGLLGSLIFAALVLALQERHPKVAVGLDGESSTGETTSGQAISVDPAFAVIAPHEIPSPSSEAAASTQAPVPAPTPEINRPNAQANAGPESSARLHDSARVIPPKVLNIRHRSFVRSRFLDIKMRLITLWHQSLARSQRPSAGQGFWNSNKGGR